MSKTDQDSTRLNKTDQDWTRLKKTEQTKQNLNGLNAAWWDFLIVKDPWEYSKPNAEWLSVTKDKNWYRIRMQWSAFIMFSTIPCSFSALLKQHPQPTIYRWPVIARAKPSPHLSQIQTRLRREFLVCTYHVFLLSLAEQSDQKFCSWHTLDGLPGSFGTEVKNKSTDLWCCWAVRSRKEALFFVQQHLFYTRGLRGIQFSVLRN